MYIGDGRKDAEQQRSEQVVVGEDISNAWRNCQVHWGVKLCQRSSEGIES